jgi:nucleoside-diphosphate-sugar epimerase
MGADGLIAMPHLFCFGLGYSAQALAQHLLKQGWTVSGTVRNADKAGPRDTRIKALAFDGSGPSDEVRSALKQATHILVSAPPGEAGDPVLACHGADIAAQAGHLKWIGYLSTVGVYGNRGGVWVDEETPPAPVNERGRRRLAAELDWAALGAKAGIPVAVFRLAGIYGPGRSPFEKLKRGEARRIVKPGQIFNRIHVNDIAAVLAASIARPPETFRVYNVCDDEPAPPQDLTAFAAKLLGVPPPPEEPFETAELSPMAKSFYADNKRCRNARIKTELGVELAFPDYRAGLTALYERGGY